MDHKAHRNMKKQIIIIISVLALILIIGGIIGFMLIGELNGTSKVQGNLAEVILNVSWLQKPLVIKIEDPNGIKLERPSTLRFKNINVGKFENVDFGPLDLHFIYRYKNRKIKVQFETVQLDGKKVDISKPIKITIDKDTPTPKKENKPNN